MNDIVQNVGDATKKQWNVSQIKHKLVTNQTLSWLNMVLLGVFYLAMLGLFYFMAKNTTVSWKLKVFIGFMAVFYPFYVVKLEKWLAPWAEFSWAEIRRKTVSY